MNPFLLALVQSGIISQADAERMNRSLDPVAARAWGEQQLAIAMQNGLSAQQQRLADMLRRTNGNLSERALDTFWRAEDERLYAAILPTLDAIASERAIGIVVSSGNEAMWQQVNQAVLDWTHSYYTAADPDFVGSVPNLNQTSREQVAEAYTRWANGELDGGRGLPDLIAELEQSFSPVRASRIAITEATRIDSEATIAAARENGDVTHLMWHTGNDELVCAICGPLNNQTVAKGERFQFEDGDGFPPAHVNCRCWISEETSETMQVQ